MNKYKQKKTYYVIRTNVRPKGFWGWIRNFLFNGNNIYIISGKDRWCDLESDLHSSIRKMCN